MGGTRCQGGRRRINRSCGGDGRDPGSCRQGRRSWPRGGVEFRGHTVRVSWVDGKQSIIELPEKQFTVFSVLLKDRQIVAELPDKPPTEAPSAPLGVSKHIAGFASSVFSKGLPKSPSAEVPVHDVTEQIGKLAALHAQGILTDTEFSDKKAELLKRL
ncbi:MAG: SHOCT domain-containing protein [Actinomycetales bacterium]|nr:SHOCT domain-containing protein [Actinomycetales bacterium]